MTGVGVVSYNGEVISRANRVNISGVYGGVGHGWDGYGRSVIDLQCLQTFSKLMLESFGNLFFDTF